MEYLNISIEASDLDSFVDVKKLEYADILAKDQAKQFMTVLRRIIKKSGDDIEVSINNNSELNKAAEAAIANALSEDYKGTEQKLVFRFGEGPVMLASTKEKHPSMDIEINPLNMEDIIKFIDRTATKPRDSEKKEQISETLLGELQSELVNIATNVERPRFVKKGSHQDPIL